MHWFLPLVTAAIQHESSAIPAESYRDKAAYYRRQLSKGCGKKPSWELARLLDRAAAAMADAERARFDPTISPTERAQINREDRLCQKALQIAKERSRPVKEQPFNGVGFTV